MKLILQAATLVFLFIALHLPVLAQSDIGNIKPGFKKDKNHYSFSSDKANVRLEFCTPEMVRIRTSWDKTFEDNENLMVIKYDWPLVKVDAEENNDHFLLSTSELRIKIFKTSFAIEIANKEGDILSSELGNESGGAYKDGETVGARKKLMPDEHFFGFGERMDFIDQRGKDVHLNVGRGTKKPHIIGAYNILEANYSPVPFFMSTKGYGIFLHNSYATNWDMGNSHAGTYEFEAEGGELDYYFIYGPEFPAILDQYTSITGKSPLLPRFAHGLHVGTYSGGTWGHEKKTSTHYVVALAKRFREMGIPVDVFHLDSTWRRFGKSGGSGATTFEWRETFDNPEAMFDSLYAMNLNMVGLHVRPRLDDGTKLNLLASARNEGFVIYPEDDNPGEFVNFFDQKAVDWWWENGVMKIADQGAMFLKTDEGSAFGRLANESNKIGPNDAQAKKLHNVFPVAYAKAPFEKFKALNGMRGMNHTREGYAGIQRYPFIWAGDWPSEWQYFKPVITAGINMGLSGIGYWTHNMGGFEHNADPELYIRWVQFGMFSPVAHVFGMDHPGYKEPWNYGEDALKNFTKYGRLRYRLIPYIYSNAFEQHRTGMPIMRALVLENQNDESTYAVDDQYMFGKSLMVCPVTTKGAQTRIIYLPEGEWFDYWSGELYEGKKYYNIVTPLDQLPMFVKAGGILAMQDEIQYDDKKAWGDITFEIFPGEASSFELYEDDGINEAYQKGIYSITKVTSEVNGATTSINIGKAEGDFEVPERNYILKIHQEKAPAQISMNGSKKLKSIDSEKFAEPKTSGWYFDEESKLLWVKGSKAGKEELSFTISN